MVPHVGKDFNSYSSSLKENFRTSLRKTGYTEETEALRTLREHFTPFCSSASSAYT